MTHRLRTIAIAFSLVLFIATVALWIVRPKHIANLNFRRQNSYFISTTSSGLALGRYVALFAKPIGLSINAQFNQDIQICWRDRNPAPKPTFEFTIAGLGYVKYFTALSIANSQRQLILTESDVLIPYWLILLSAAVLPTREAWQRLTARRRTNRALCPACGYDLRATPDRCPECGAIPSPPSHQTPRESAAARPAST
jgi:hypothetical protein